MTAIVVLALLLALSITALAVVIYRTNNTSASMAEELTESVERARLGYMTRNGE